MRSVLSHVPVKKTHCHHSWGEVGRVGRPTRGRERLQVCGCWWLQPHCLRCGERNRCYSTTRESRLSPVPAPIEMPCPLLWRRFFFFFSTFPGRWAARWWWTPTPFAGRRSAWPASRPSCASLSRRSSGRWRKGPGWAWGSANTSLGTADGTARATTSISEKYCNKVRDEKMEHFTCWYLGVSCCIFPQF